MHLRITSLWNIKSSNSKNSNTLDTNVQGLTVALTICNIILYFSDKALGNVKTDETLTDRGIFVSQPWWCLYNCSPILVFMVIFLDLSNKHFFWSKFLSFEFTPSISLNLFWYGTIYKLLGILKNALRKMFLVPE